jgi:hypothetical protein
VSSDREHNFNQVRIAARIGHPRQIVMREGVLLNGAGLDARMATSSYLEIALRYS